ncbi:MAG: SDR family NAD(P)-dependent oxidoreductase [Propylenella sp.]
MQLSFADKSVVVAGASRGIGLAMALSFARAGARVAICARGREGLGRCSRRDCAPRREGTRGDLRSRRRSFDR